MSFRSDAEVEKWESGEKKKKSDVEWISRWPGYAKIVGNGDKFIRYAIADIGG